MAIYTISVDTTTAATLKAAADKIGQPTLTLASSILIDWAKLYDKAQRLAKPTEATSGNRNR